MHSPYTRDPNDLRFGPIQSDQPKRHGPLIRLCVLSAVCVVACLIAALLLGGW